MISIGDAASPHGAFIRVLLTAPDPADLAGLEYIFNSRYVAVFDGFIFDLSNLRTLNPDLAGKLLVVRERIVGENRRIAFVSGSMEVQNVLESWVPIRKDEAFIGYHEALESFRQPNPSSARRDSRSRMPPIIPNG